MLDKNTTAEAAPDGAASAGSPSALAATRRNGRCRRVAPGGRRPAGPPLQAMMSGDGPVEADDAHGLLHRPARQLRARTRCAPNAARGERRQSMRGFEDTYIDIVDYIVRITDRIWEYQDVGYIYDTYAPGCLVYDDRGANIGVERVVTGTINMINAFPDATHCADDVIWAGNDEEGFVTSHRYVGTAHHLGRLALRPGHRAQGQPVGHRQLRDPGERDLRGVGALQHVLALHAAGHRREVGGARVRQRAAGRHRRPADPRDRAADRRPAPRVLPGLHRRSLRRRAFRAQAVARPLQPARLQRRRPRLRPHGALARHVGPGRLRTRRRARAGAEPAGHVPRPGHAGRRGLLHGQRRRGLPGVGAVDRARHPPRLRPVRRRPPVGASTSGASASCTSTTAGSPRNGRASTSSTCWPSCWPTSRGR